MTAAEDELLAADYGALRGRALLGDGRLTRGWLAVVRQGADVNRLRKTLPDVLHRLEQAGVFEASLYTARSSDEQSAWASGSVTNAGAETVSATSSFSAGTIALTGAMRVGWWSQNPHDVVTLVEQFVAYRPDGVVKPSLGRR